jgi:hypothetical protein
LAILAGAYARSSSDGYHLFALIDSLVISDPDYLSTVEGLQCLILLAKAYTDIGQPRKAWMMWQKGMVIAKLKVSGLHLRVESLPLTWNAQGIYQVSAVSPALQAIWWAIYHGDRFTSMLLGLPYGFNDVHYGPILESMQGSAEHRFILRCAFVAGKVIDRNIVPAQPSFAKAMDLDEQMEAIAASMPESWWTIPVGIERYGRDLDELRDRLLQQFYFFHVRMYIHLPFLAGPQTTAGPRAVDAAYEMLRRFQLLRAEVAGAPLFDCKTSDFVAFTAAVVLLLDTLGPGSSATLMDPEDCMRIARSTQALFAADKMKSNCKIAHQCWTALEMLFILQGDGGVILPAGQREIVIPHFGTLVVRNLSELTSPQRRPTRARKNPHGGSSGISSPVYPSSDSTTRDASLSAGGYSVEYRVGGNMIDQTLGGIQHDIGDSTDDTLSWLDAAMLDVDQGWGLPDLWGLNESTPTGEIMEAL